MRNRGCFQWWKRQPAPSIVALVRTITGALHTPKSGIQAAIEKLTEPQVKIVSLTITEKGYCTDPRSRTLDLSHPLIKHDLADPEHPRSALGLIVEALRIRRQQGLPRLVYCRAITFRKTVI